MLIVHTKHILSILVSALLLLSLFVNINPCEALYSSDVAPLVFVHNRYFHFKNYFFDYYVDKRGFQISNNLTERWCNLLIGLNFTYNNNVNVSRLTGGLDFRWRARNGTGRAFIIGRDIIYESANYWLIFYLAYELWQNSSYINIYAGLNCSLPANYNITNPVLFYRMTNITISGDAANDFIAIPENNGTEIFLPATFEFEYNTTIHALQTSLWDNVTGKFVEFLWSKQFYFNGQYYDVARHTIRGFANGNVQVEWRYANRVPVNTFFVHKWSWQDPSDCRFMRGDKHTINGLNEYKLTTTQSSIHKLYQKFALSSFFRPTTWKIKAWLRDDEGDEYYELSGGTFRALVIRTSNGNGMQNNTWNCPSYSNINETDAIVVRVYMSILGWSTYLCGTFITEQLQATYLNATTWTVCYYTYAWFVTRPSQQHIGQFHWGTTTYNSRILGITYMVPLAAWNLVATWNFTLMTRQWLSVASWTFDLLTRAWTSIASWSFDLLTRAWTSIAEWTFTLLSSGWRTVITWFFTLAGARYVFPFILIIMAIFIVVCISIGTGSSEENT